MKKQKSVHGQCGDCSPGSPNGLPIQTYIAPRNGQFVLVISIYRIIELSKTYHVDVSSLNEHASQQPPSDRASSPGDEHCELYTIRSPNLALCKRAQ